MAVPSSASRFARFEELDARTRRWLLVRSLAVSVGSVTVVVVAFYVLPWDRNGARAVALGVAFGLLMVAVATVFAVRYVLRSEHPLLRAFEALGVVVGIAIVWFAAVYVTISTRDAAAFSEQLGKTDGLYFSLTTATTIGYGDISPRTEGARVVVMIHMVTNVVVLGVAARVIINAARRRASVR